MPNNRPDWIDDEVVSQSPRKGSTIVMDDIVLPPENDFAEISQRPSEIEYENAKIENENGVDAKTDEHRPDSSSSQCSYQEMNMKEASHADEKEELAAEIVDTEPTVFVPHHTAHDIEPVDLFGRSSLHEQDPMSMSYYNNGTDKSPFESPFKQEVDMNAVQPLPDDIIDVEEAAAADTNGNRGVQFGDNQQLVDLVNNQFNIMDINQSEPAYAGSYDAGDELTKEFAAEKEKHHMEYSESFEQQSSITQVVHELATEVTSVLNEFETHHRTADAPVMQYDATFNASDVNGSSAAFGAEPNDTVVIQKSELSVSASEFVPATKSEMDADPMFAPVEQLVGEQVQQVLEPQQTEAEANERLKEADIVLAAAAVATATAAAAAVAVTAAKAPAKPLGKSPAKTTETKKTDVKAKPTTAIRKSTITATRAAPARPGIFHYRFILVVVCNLYLTLILFSFNKNFNRCAKSSITNIGRFKTISRKENNFHFIDSSSQAIEVIIYKIKMQCKLSIEHHSINILFR